jgi:hypothetical protein
MGLELLQMAQSLHGPRDNPINRQPPGRFPYLDELMADAQVRAALDTAWRDTNADTIPVTAGCEQGGWIYMDLRTGRLTIVRQPNSLGAPAAPGQNQRGAFCINLGTPPRRPGAAIVGQFHTHPSVPFTGASDGDRALGGQYGVPCIVRGRNNQYDYTGTPRRSGTLADAARNPGYPS